MNKTFLSKTNALYHYYQVTYSLAFHNSQLLIC